MKPFAERAEQIITNAIDLRLKLIDLKKNYSSITAKDCYSILDKIENLETAQEYAKFICLNFEQLVRIQPGITSEMKKPILSLFNEAKTII